MIRYAKLYFMPIQERRVALQSAVINMPEFAFAAGFVEPELQREAILSSAELLLVQAESTRNALAVLYGTGNQYFSPYSGQQAINYESEISGFSSVANKPFIEYLLECDYQKDSRARKILRSTLPLYLEVNLESLSRRQADERANQDIFWQKVGPSQKREKIISFIDGFDGSNLWQKYQAFRTPFLAGQRGPYELQWETEVFDAIERAAGLQDQEILFQAVELIKDLGFENVDDFLELMYGVTTDEVTQDMDALLQVFSAMTGKKGRRKLFLQRQLEATSNADQSLPEGLAAENLQKDLLDLGIPIDEWEKKMAILTNVTSDIAAAQFAAVFYPPELSGEYPDLEKDPVWSLIKDKYGFLLSRDSDHHPEAYRYLYHEAGHALEVFLRLKEEENTGQLLGSSFIGTPLVLREIFSLFYEGRMPLEEYFIARERFLTARFAALAKHEITLWQEAEKVVKAIHTTHDPTGREYSPKELRRRTLKAKTTFNHTANRSYKETLDRAVNARVPTGRSVRDFFTPIAAGQAASYAYGMLGAISMRKIIRSTQDPYSRLTNLAQITSTSENIYAVLGHMGMGFQQALNNLREFFTPKDIQ